MDHVTSQTSPAPPWIVTTALDTAISLPDGSTASRDDFHAWLWEHADGLLGIHEGTVTAADAAALGMVPTALVIDAAAAPPDRDWVAQLAVTEVEWWFRDETTAQQAVRLVGSIWRVICGSLPAAMTSSSPTSSRQCCSSTPLSSADT